MVLGQLDVSSLRHNWSQGAVARAPQTGDLVQHPQLRRSYLCLTSHGDRGKASARRFRPYPLAGKCAVHGGNCWRIVPGQEEFVLPRGATASNVLCLIPQPASKGKSLGKNFRRQWYNSNIFPHFPCQHTESTYSLYHLPVGLLNVTLCEFLFMWLWMM